MTAVQVEPSRLDSEDTTERAEGQAGALAEAATRYALRRGADPFSVIDLAVAEMTRFRLMLGESAEHVARDPLTALLRDLRHKRLAPAMVDVICAMAAKWVDGGDTEWDDCHARRRGDWGPLMCLTLIDLACLPGDDENLADAAVDHAARFARDLPRWRNQIAFETLGEGHDDSVLERPDVIAAIAGAADEFIAALLKAGAP